MILTKALENTRSTASADLANRRRDSVRVCRSTYHLKSLYKNNRYERHSI